MPDGPYNDDFAVDDEDDFLDDPPEESAASAGNLGGALSTAWNFKGSVGQDVPNVNSNMNSFASSAKYPPSSSPSSAPPLPAGMLTATEPMHERDVPSDDEYDFPDDEPPDEESVTGSYEFPS